MPFGETAGRGFEGPAAPYFWGAIFIVTLVVWAWYHFSIHYRGGPETKSHPKDEDD